MKTIYKDNKSWDDVIAGFSLINNFNKKEELLLNDLIKYLSITYPDMFITEKLDYCNCDYPNCDSSDTFMSC